MNVIEVGRLLRAGATGFIFGCRVSQKDGLMFGGLVRVPLPGDYQIYGLIHDIHIDDDGLVRQLVTADGVNESIIADNRVNRNVPLEISVLAVGYRQNGQIYHLLPPYPPLSLDVIYSCQAEELCEFTSAGHFGYFRHVLRASDLPVGEILAAHLKQAHEAHCDAGNPDWSNLATQELITLLRDDYATLMAVLSAVADCRLR
ncbi:MAG: hypothetical protein ACM3PY_18455 [Omnitrophica WOR_2 bacterium]